MIPEGTTHKAEFYGRELFYKRVEVPYLNSVIDHPIHQWQTLVKWYWFDLGKWVDAGAGFSSRNVKPI